MNTCPCCGQPVELPLLIDRNSATFRGEKFRVRGGIYRLILIALRDAFPSAVDTETLIYRGWRNNPPMSVDKALHVYISKLRRELPSGLTIKTIFYALHDTGYALEMRTSEAPNAHNQTTLSVNGNKGDECKRPPP